MNIIILSLWIAVSIGVYIYASRSYAMWIVLIGGWILLPPAHYQAAGHPLIFPFWIIGSALPSDLLITKAWVAPIIAILGSLIFDRQRWSNIRYHWTDFAVLAFCFWPLAQSMVLKQSELSNVISCLYLIGVWGVPWLIGRLYLRDFNDALAFASILTLATLAMLPFMILESVSAYRIYTDLYGAHPFAFDGMERYIGFRPQLFFENGNQYGIWCAGATVAAFWRRQESLPRERPFWSASYYALLAITIISQSVGAILLMLSSLAMLSTPKSFKLVQRFGALSFAACLVLGTLHVSGIVPLRSIAEKTVVGKSVVGNIRAIGRGSFVWRLGQDVKALPVIKENLVTGSGRWDWFMALRSRPWGFPLLLLGQFGLIGLFCLVAALFGALYRHISSAARGYGPSQLVTVMLLMFGVDALLNSFIFYPAILVASAFFRRKSKVKVVAPIVREDGIHQHAGPIENTKMNELSLATSLVGSSAALPSQDPRGNGVQIPSSKGQAAMQNKQRNKFRRA